MTWYYNGKEFTDDDIGTFTAFVYRIISLDTGKHYIGKKRFRRKVSKPPLKGYKRKRVSYTTSDYADYFGSNDTLKADVEKYGKDRFKREILKLCNTLGQSSYWEAYHQLTEHVLLHPDKYYNNFVGCKIHSKHLGLDKA